ncbi:hypothetical protein EJ377_14535 [Chryseobacterium arthrosphaerae]|uniref:RHS repeat-associated core domain-containing protein n=1 Tax=Chryseobacterium arthrosphaerae TaxID=651561 RepID=A0A3S0PNB8_9FLAO|nr:hypothetical protein EJ377_14535 [Chryseobacterium arthrosphaerae]
MKDKGIQSIAYNYLNLSNEFTMQQNSFGPILYSAVNYLYSADGTKLRKTYSSRPQRGLTSYRTTDYLDGFNTAILMVEVIFVWDAEPKMLTKYRRIKIF